jgi:hypothetical protein
MKLLTTAIELELEFKRLLKEYKQYYWSTAWAGIGSKAYNSLVLKKERILKICVGVHFYQTHPSFIKEFLNDERVRFVQQPSGTFHPKLYLFYNNDSDWELIIGSANFTNSAFTKNLEASILINHSEKSSSKILEKALLFVNRIWDKAKVADQDYFERYFVIWEKQQQKLKSLSGMYGAIERVPKPIHESEMVNRTWKAFMIKIRNEPNKGMLKRLQVIRLAKSIFSKEKEFHDLDIEERKFIAGIPNNLELEGAEHWGCFGSMKGAGVFKNKIHQGNIHITNALKHIPLSGQITKNDYSLYIENFQMAFKGTHLEKAINLATATRLLCMKRPDIFVCFDSENRSKMCKDFGIVQTRMSYNRYWDDIIERIYDSDWWNNTAPKNNIEREISEARAAFLDSMYYLEDK